MRHCRGSWMVSRPEMPSPFDGSSGPEDSSPMERQSRRGANYLKGKGLASVYGFSLSSRDHLPDSRAKASVPYSGVFMYSSERKIQERLGAALQGLAEVEQHGATDGAGRPAQRLLKLLRQLVSDLDVAFRALQE